MTAVLALLIRKKNPHRHKRYQFSVPVHGLAHFPYYKHQDEAAKKLLRESNFSLLHSTVLEFKLAV